MTKRIGEEARPTTSVSVSNWFKVAARASANTMIAMTEAIGLELTLKHALSHDCS